MAAAGLPGGAGALPAQTLAVARGKGVRPARRRAKGDAALVLAAQQALAAGAAPPIQADAGRRAPALPGRTRATSALAHVRGPREETARAAPAQTEPAPVRKGSATPQDVPGPATPARRDGTGALEPPPHRELARLRFVDRRLAPTAAVARALAGLKERAVHAAPAPEPVAAPPRKSAPRDAPHPVVREMPAAARLLELAGRLSPPLPAREAAPAWPRLLEQVQGRLELLRLGEGGGAELSLEPEELGSLRLLLRQEQGGWRLEIHAGVASTAQELQRRAQDLHDQLARAGLRLEELRLFCDGPARATAAEAPGQPAGGRPASDFHHGAERRERGGEDRRPGQETPESGAAEEEFASRLDRLLKTK